jgi:hypothetical protein
MLSVYKMGEMCVPRGWLHVHVYIRDDMNNCLVGPIMWVEWGMNISWDKLFISYR